MMAKTPTRVLLIEDNSADVVLMRIALASDTLRSFELTTAEYLGAALVLLKDHSFDVILLDLGLPDTQGLETFTRLHQAHPHTPTVILSGLLDEALALQAVQAGAQDYLVKGLSSRDTLSRAIRYAIERKRGEESLQASERMLKLFVEHAPAAIAMFDRDMRYIVVSRRFVTDFHLEAQDIIGRSHYEVFPDIPERWKENNRRCLAGATEEAAEDPFLRADGTLEWVRWEVHPWYEPSGAIGGLLLFTELITKRKRAEEALRRNQAMLARTESVAHLGSWEWDVATDTVTWSDELFRLFQRNPADGAPSFEEHTELFHPEDMQRLQEAVGVAVSQGRPYEIELRALRKDGATWVCLARGQAEIGPEGSATRLFGSIQDITERKRAEEALRESEEQYRGLMESLDSVVATVDHSGRFLYMNDVAAQQMGSNVQALTGKTMHELFPAPIASRQLENLRRVMSTDRGIVSESRSVVRGQPRWYRTMMQPIHDERGRVTCVLVNATDIHDLKTTQQELLELNRTLEERVRERTAQVQDLYDNAPMGYHSIDADGNVVMVNQTELNWLGYAREEMVGRSLADFLVPADQPNFEANFAKLKQDGELRDVELELIRKDGSHFPVLLNSSAIYDERGTFVASRASLLDITKHKQAEDALRESEEQNRLLFEAAPDAMILFDEKDRMARVNSAFERLTGYRAEQAIGRTLPEVALLPHDEVMQLGASMMQDLALKHVAAADFKLRRANSESHDVSARAFGVQIGGHPHVLLTLRDITAEKQAAETLRLANAELARAVRAKDEFLANMSHELRTPLSAILLFTENLLAGARGPLNERQQAALRNIEASGRHLLTLINDILDLSKVEAGRLELQRETVAITEVCQASLVFVKETAIKKGLRLGFQLNDQLAQMSADPRRLKQMLVNLLSNAVKFTPAGGQVNLEVDVDAEAGAVRFAVQDSGIGIAAADIARLFQPFTQLDSGLNRQYEGSGLGLSLVRRLAELHGGSVAVESTVGQGCRFTIALPYQPSEPADPPDAPLPGAATNGAAVAAGMCILLAEDNEANIRGMGEYLQDRGYDVVVARNGQEALGMAVARRPALILMDIQMPTMDGLEATRRLRGLPEFAATPIIALTALAMPGDRERCLAAGANDYLTKPVSLKGLVETMQQWLGKPE
jgi:PAS domain S-box-containing protein